MRLVFEGLDSKLEIGPSAVSVLRVEDAVLYSRFVQSLLTMLGDDSLEKGALFEGDKELRPARVLHVVGDVSSVDLEDKRFVSLALKRVIRNLEETQDGEAQQLIAKLRSLVLGLTYELEGDYEIPQEINEEKILKALGFGIENDPANSMEEKLTRYLDLAADLVPEKILVFMNLRCYLSEEQYLTFCERAIAKSLMIVSCERGESSRFENLENGLFIDKYYLEYCS